jgi:hypothetical protein
MANHNWQRQRVEGSQRLVVKTSAILDHHDRSHQTNVRCRRNHLVRRLEGEENRLNWDLMMDEDHPWALPWVALWVARKIQTSEGTLASIKVLGDLVDQMTHPVTAADRARAMMAEDHHHSYRTRALHLCQIYDRSALWTRVYDRGQVVIA